MYAVQYAKDTIGLGCGSSVSKSGCFLKIYWGLNSALFSCLMFLRYFFRPAMEESNAFYVVRKGNTVAVYKNFNDCQAQVSSSVCVFDHMNLFCLFLVSYFMGKTKMTLHFLEYKVRFNFVLLASTRLI